MNEYICLNVIQQAIQNWIQFFFILKKKKKGFRKVKLWWCFKSLTSFGLHFSNDILKAKKKKTS